MLEPTTAIGVAVGAISGILTGIFAPMLKTKSDREVLVDGIEQRLWLRMEDRVRALEAEVCKLQEVAEQAQKQRDEALARAHSAEDRVGELKVKVEQLERIIERRSDPRT